MHRRQKPVLGADVAQHLDVEPARELEPPVPLPRTNPPRQRSVRLHPLQVAGVEVHRLPRSEGQRHRTRTHPRIVHRLDAHRPRPARTVDDARKPLVPRLLPTRRRRKQRQPVCSPGIRHRREIRQMPRRTRKQAHHLHRLPRTHHQPPLPRAPTERPLKSPTPRLQLLRAHRARPPRRHRQLHRTAGGRSRIVNPLDAHPRTLRPRVDQPQPAHLLRVVPRIEYRHPLLRLPRRRHIVHRGQKPVLGADVGQHLYVEHARQLQTPVPLARSGLARQRLVRLHPLQVVGVEVHRLPRPEGERHRTVRHPLVVMGLDAHLARRVGAVDDACKALVAPLPRPARGGREQRNAMPRPRRRARRELRPGALGRALQAHIQGKGVRRRRRVRRRGVHRVRHLRMRARALHAPTPLDLVTPRALRLRAAPLPVARRCPHRVLPE